MSRPVVIVLLAAGAAVIAWRGTARASDREPASRVICIETAGLAVRLVGEGGDEDALEAARGCSVPLPPAGLPGEHLVSALLDDGSALELRRVPGEPTAVVIAAGEALERSGWTLSPASAALRGRAPGTAAVEFEGPGRGVRAMVWATGDGQDADPLLAVAISGGSEP
jgi:hypothetical protein